MFVVYRIFLYGECSEIMQELLGSDLRNMKGQVMTSASGMRQPTRKQLRESSLSDSKSTEVSTSLSAGECDAVDSSPLHSTSNATEVTSENFTFLFSHKFTHELAYEGSYTSAHVDDPIDVEKIHHNLVRSFL